MANFNGLDALWLRENAPSAYAYQSAIPLLPATVENAGQWLVLWAPAARGVVAEVVDREVPRHRLVLRGEEMYLVVLRQAINLVLCGIGAGFEDHHAHSGIGEARRDGRAAWSGADGT
jgi:hypothetical protein